MSRAMKYAYDMQKAVPAKLKTAKTPVRPIGENLMRLVGEGKRFVSITQLAEHCKMHARTVNRIIYGEAATQLDSINMLAMHLGCEPWQLLVPDADLTNPPVLQPVTEREKQLWALIRGKNGNGIKP